MDDNFDDWDVPMYGIQTEYVSRRDRANMSESELLLYSIGKVRDELLVLGDSEQGLDREGLYEAYNLLDTVLTNPIHPLNRPQSKNAYLLLIGAYLIDWDKVDRMEPIDPYDVENFAPFYPINEDRKASLLQYSEELAMMKVSLISAMKVVHELARYELTPVPEE